MNPFADAQRSALYASRKNGRPPAQAIESITPAGEADCVCISVDAPDHLYVTSDYIVTHNTLQTISLLTSVRQDTGRLRSLIVAPKSVVPNWAAEWHKFAPFVRVHMWEGTNRMRRETEARNAEVLLTGYSLVIRDREFFDSIGLDYLVLDEAQAIKNPYSATTQAVKALRADHRLAMTGTPVENRLNEFWSLFDFTSPGLLGSLATFEAAIRGAQAGDSSAVARLRQLVGPFLLRRIKSEVAKDLPAKILVDYVCPMTDKQKEAYDEALAQTRVSLGGASRMHVLAAITRLRQLACDVRITRPVGAWGDDDSGKVMAIRELLDTCREGGHKVLVFSQFVEMLGLLRTVLERDGCVCEYLDGQTKNRQACVDRFQTNPKVNVFLISLRAGGTGLNLTAADTVIHFDPWWNPAVEAQATDRAYRIGQTRPVTVYRMIAKGTIEQKIAILKARKAKLSNTVLAEGVTAGDELSAADIRDLLS